jgi:SAM-dependent methyltransferase
LGPKIDPLTTRMAQTTTGLHSILSSATAYRLFQGLLGGHATRAAFVRDQIRPFAGANILDVGCGPADVLDYLPATVNYWGFDISRRYIAKACDRHGDRGRFFAKEFEPSDLVTMPPMDVAIATGLFHHLDDATATSLLATIRDALKPGGRLVTLDGVFEPGQNPVARWLIARDRGQHVRTRAEYEALYARVFASPRMIIQHRTWLPYTYCLAECIRPLS